MLTVKKNNTTSKALILASGAILLLFVVMLESCVDVPLGVKTSVTGNVLDPVKNKLLARQKIIIYGCQFTYGDYGTVCDKLVDSTRTDSNGSYSMNFTADGTDASYVIGIIASSDIAVGAAFSHPIQLMAGKANAVDFKARELSYLKTTVHIDSNSINNLSFSTSNFTNYYVYSVSMISMTTKDTVVVNRILPDTTNVGNFSTWDIKAGRFRSFSASPVSAGFQDTIAIDINVGNVSDWPLN